MEISAILHKEAGRAHVRTRKGLRQRGRLPGNPAAARGVSCTNASDKEGAELGKQIFKFF